MPSHNPARGALNVSAGVVPDSPTIATGRVHRAIIRSFAPGSTRVGRPTRRPRSRTDFRNDSVVTCGSSARALIAIVVPVRAGGTAAEIRGDADDCREPPDGR